MIGTLNFIIVGWFISNFIWYIVGKQILLAVIQANAKMQEIASAIQEGSKSLSKPSI